MQITKTFTPHSISEWRTWLENNHESETEIWLIFDTSLKNVNYIESVYEAICFGWIDGIAKKMNTTQLAQRFTPRKQKSNWTELNKERARWLIRNNKMTPAGSEVLPDLDRQFIIPDHIEKEINSVPKLLQNFQKFPELYKRVRVSYINEFKKGTPEYAKRLAYFVKQTYLNRMFGNWSDSGKLLT
jgi:uncharacterized protein YdeI (YjbR/CyaY-like superfamily)